MLRGVLRPHGITQDSAHGARGGVTSSSLPPPPLSRYPEQDYACSRRLMIIYSNHMTPSVLAVSSQPDALEDILPCFVARIIGLLPEVQ